MSNVLKDEELAAIKNAYNLKSIKTLAKSKKILLSRVINKKRQNKNKNELISEIFSKHGQNVFTNVEWNNETESSSSDDDDDEHDENNNENNNENNDENNNDEEENMNESMNIDQGGQNSHSIMIRIYSSSFNKQLSYAKFRRKVENRGESLSTEMSGVLCKHLEKEGVSCDVGSTMTQLTVSENVPTAPMTMKQLPPTTDAKYHKKKYALVRNQRESLAQRSANALSVIKGGGLVVFHPTSDEADNKQRELNVIYLGNYAKLGDQKDKDKINKHIKKLNDDVVEQLKNEKNKGKIVVSVFDEFENELNQLEQQYKEKQIEYLEYLEKKSALTDKKMLMINGNKNNNNNNNNKKPMSEDEDEDEDTEEEDEYEEEQEDLSMMNDVE